MNIRPDIQDFGSKLEVFAKRNLSYPMEVKELLQIVVQTGQKDEFEELVFQTKLLVQIKEVMKRIGQDADGFEKLSIELQSSTQKSVDILKILIKKAPVEVSQKFIDTFFTIEAESFERLMKFFSDLSWVKNWQIDGNSLPYQVKLVKKPSIQDDLQSQTMNTSHGENGNVLLSRIQRSAVFVIVLFVLFILLDPPVTILGWILSLGIAVFLVYIVLQIYILNRP